MKIEIRKPTEQELLDAQSWPVWSKEVSGFPWSYAEKETCLILKGLAEVETSEGEKSIFKAGDFVVFPAGLECFWRIKEGLAKKYRLGE
jgi:uncharacterized protein